MISTKLNHETYEHWMRLELQFAREEYAWAYDVRDYKQANRCHELRWKCMDLALDSLGKGQTEHAQ